MAMAFLPEEDQENQEQGPQSQVAGAPVLSGSTSQEQQGQGAKGPTKSGSYTNLRSYLTANAGNDAKMASDLSKFHAGRPEGAYNPAQIQRAASANVKPNIVNAAQAANLKSNHMGDIMSSAKEMYGQDGKQYSRGQGILDAFLIGQGPQAEQVTSNIISSADPSVNEVANRGGQFPALQAAIGSSTKLPRGPITTTPEAMITTPKTTPTVQKPSKYLPEPKNKQVNKPLPKDKLDVKKALPKSAGTSFVPDKTTLQGIMDMLGKGSSKVSEVKTPKVKKIF